MPLHLKNILLLNPVSDKKYLSLITKNKTVWESVNLQIIVYIIQTYFFYSILGFSVWLNNISNTDRWKRISWQVDEFIHTSSTDGHSKLWIIDF